jgi:hypothetical protein
VARHRRDGLAAARGYSALFRGEQSAAALAAGIRLSLFVERQIQFVEAHAKPRGR